MKKISLALFVCSILIVNFNGCVSLPINQSGKYVEITDIKFRKKGSINTDILWAGIARKSGTNTFDSKFFPKIEHEIKARKVTEIYNEDTKKAAFEAALNAGIEIVEGKTSAEISSKTEIKSNIHVFKIFEINSLVKELNSEANREDIESLLGYDAPRIITSIAVVFNYKAKEKINRSGEIELTIKNPEIGNPELDLKIANTGETVATLSDGTVFAFEYSRFCWEKRNGKIIIKALEVDRPGFDNDCPKGTEDNPTKL